MICKGISNREFALSEVQPLAILEMKMRPAYWIRQNRIEMNLERFNIKE